VRPRGLPDVVAEGLPIGRDLRALQNWTLVGVRLNRDALVQDEAAGAVNASTNDDRVAGDNSFDRGLNGGRLIERSARGVSFPVGRDVVDVRCFGDS
jgi:hypothetical protein